jgi:hypothetical protein
MEMKSLIWEVCQHTRMGEDPEIRLRLDAIIVLLCAVVLTQVTLIATLGGVMVFLSLLVLLLFGTVGVYAYLVSPHREGLPLSAPPK